MTQASICPTCGYPHEFEPCERCHGVIRDLHGVELHVGRGFFVLDLLRGFWSLFGGCLTLFNRPEFAGKLRGPFLANILVLTVVFFGMFFGLWELFEWLLSDSWGWLEWMRPAGDVVSAFVAMILAAVALFLLAPVLIETVMGPFLDPLAEVTEQIHGGANMRAVDPGVWKSAMTGVRSSAQILAIQIIVLPVCLLLSLSGIGAIIAILLAAMLNAIIWFDIPTARRGLGLRHRLKVIRRNWPQALGFGLAFQLGLVIPLFNIVMLTPATAVAVSTLYLRFDKRVSAPRFDSNAA